MILPFGRVSAAAAEGFDVFFSCRHMNTPLLSVRQNMEHYYEYCNPGFGKFCSDVFEYLVSHGADVNICDM